MFFFVNTKYVHKYNVSLNKTVTKLCTILTLCFFPYLNPTSYLKSQLKAQFQAWDNFLWLKALEKSFLFHLNKLNLLLANQILFILCILIKLNIWYSWSLKILAIKRWFPFSFAIVLQGRHFVVDGPKNLKLLVDISFESGYQNIVLLSWLLFSCACY